MLARCVRAVQPALVVKGARLMTAGLSSYSTFSVSVCQKHLRIMQTCIEYQYDDTNLPQALTAVTGLQTPFGSEIYINLLTLLE